MTRAIKESQSAKSSSTGWLTTTCTDEGFSVVLALKINTAIPSSASSCLQYRGSPIFQTDKNPKAALSLNMTIEEKPPRAATATITTDSSHHRHSNHDAPKSLRKMVKNARWLMEKRDETGRRPGLEKPPVSRRNAEDAVVPPPPAAGLAPAATVKGTIATSATTTGNSTTIVGSDDHGQHYVCNDSFSSVTLSDISGGGSSSSTLSLHKKKKSTAASRALAPVRPPDLPTAPLSLEESYSASFVLDQSSCDSFDHHDSGCSNVSDLTNSHDWGAGGNPHNSIVYPPSSHSASASGLSITAT